MSKETNKKKVSSKLLFLMGFFVLLYFKSTMFTFIGSTNAGTSISAVGIEPYLIIPHLAILGIIIFPAFFFKEKAATKYLIIIDLLYSVLLIADLWYYRASGYYLGIQYIFYKDLFNPLGKSLINPNKIDLIFLIDLPILIFCYFKFKNKLADTRKVKTAVVGIMASLVIVFGAHYLFDTLRISGSIRFVQKDWEASWSPYTRAENRSPLGDHVYEIYSTLSKVYSKDDEDKKQQAEQWLEWNNENLPDNEYKGIAKGKNVIFLQIESLENFVINQEAYGQEITPNLNKLINENLYFSNIYEQNNGANSIDCDVMANASMLTLGDSVTALTYPEVKLNSIERILEKEGYTTVSSHVERPGDWGWLQLHKAALGIQTSWDINEYELDEYAGFGLSDRSLYTQFTSKLQDLKQPFFATVPTLTSHGPFDIADKYRELQLPEEIDKNKFGGYLQSVHYADAQIGNFFNMLEEKGLKDNTIVVIYGDHSGIHKYYTEDVEATEAAGMPGDWWKKYKMQVPLLIVGNDMPSKTIDKVGGHIDIMPTVSYLLGVSPNGTQMGRNLLNTDRDASVIKGGIVVGNPTEEEREKLKQAYDVADYLIKNNYFEKSNKIG
ncbi:MAG: LTA synthase family protein [Clostridiaceae bacterium]|nr:LTA synthase family protein [Clostridiaceae bacterium]